LLQNGFINCLCSLSQCSSANSHSNGLVSKSHRTIQSGAILFLCRGGGLTPHARRPWKNAPARDAHVRCYMNNKCFYCDQIDMHMVRKHGEWFCSICIGNFNFGNLHRCAPELGEDIFPCVGYGAAVDYCEEYFNGELWVGNSEYGTQANWCLFCGYKAKTQVIWPHLTPREP